ncbi:MAG: HEAT repeat domain-containing protein [Anaerolineae bacterium]|uniref:HEAT repeat domain-containing protein n=1 Tax=Promineifilum sp. TaxID=2664178 RepID=UPI001E08793F|nr:HEAT repeat domain-containing protein [Anaerolineales bacterium]MCB8933980.1 HEAT repeat domain-containing protein [Promineifilum sp.]MCO5179380.1 HEAT repeat domain-containing protein [Promineifilum sp.]MCW5845905.1 HEAT repeat domain-containing protein [Anaerolineae bacterium]
MIRYCPHCWSENTYEAVVCASCGASLDESAKDFVTRLIDAVYHPEPTRAALAIEILGRLVEPGAVDAMLTRLARKPDSMDVTTAAAKALGLIGEGRAVPGLAKVLLDGERPLPGRLAAAEALAALGGTAAEEALRTALDMPHLPVLLRRVVESTLAGGVSIA